MFRIELEYSLFVLETNLLTNLLETETIFWQPKRVLPAIRVSILDEVITIYIYKNTFLEVILTTI